MTCDVPAAPSDEVSRLMARLDRLESEAAIRRLVAQFHRVNDAGSPSGNQPSWADLSVAANDGTTEALDQFRSANGVSWSGLGLDKQAWPNRSGAAVDDATPRAGYMPRMMHFLTNECIEIHGDRAVGSWYCWEPAVVDIDGPVAILIAGSTRCEFVREEGAWRYAAVEFEEVFSTRFDGAGWVTQPHVPYGPRRVSGLVR